MKKYWVQYLSYFAILLSCICFAITTTMAAPPTYSYTKKRSRAKTVGKDPAKQVPTTQCEVALLGFDAVGILEMLKGEELVARLKEQGINIAPFNLDIPQSVIEHESLLVKPILNYLGNTNGLIQDVNDRSKQVNESGSVLQNVLGLSYIDSSHVEVLSDFYLQLKDTAVMGPLMAQARVNHVLSEIKRVIENGENPLGLYGRLLDEMSVFLTSLSKSPQGKGLSFRVVGRLSKNGRAYYNVMHVRDLYFEIKINGNETIQYNPIEEFEFIRNHKDEPIKAKGLSQSSDRDKEIFTPPIRHKIIVEDRVRGEFDWSDTEINEVIEDFGSKMLRPQSSSELVSILNPILTDAIDAKLADVQVYFLEKLQAEEIQLIEAQDRAKEDTNMFLIQKYEEKITKIRDKIKKYTNSRMELFQFPEFDKSGHEIQPGKIRVTFFNKNGEMLKEQTEYQNISAATLQKLEQR